jgi:hypothetical protein
MKLSELKVGTKARLRSTRKDLPNYSFTGIIKVAQDSSTKEDFLWITNNDKVGYTILPEHDYLWKVEVLK